MKRLSGVLVVIVLFLVVYQLGVGWFWHSIGFEWNFDHGRVFGWATFMTRGIGFPVVFASLIARARPNDENEHWALWGFLVCWIPLLISTSVDGFVWMIASGYQTTIHDWRGGVEQLMVWLGWILTTWILFLAFRWKNMLAELVNRRLWYGVLGFFLNLFSLSRQA